MPTGYTCYIEDGEIDKGKDFLMKCARAFGACIDMRDDNLSVDIPMELKPSTYHKEALVIAYEELEKYKTMTLEEAQIIVDEDYINNQKSCRESIVKNNQIQERYSKVRKEVAEWVPPTEEHINIKKFALEQIDLSTGYNHTDYYTEELNKPKKTAQEYINNRIAGASDNIEYHTKSWDEELKRTEERNKWINDLRDSLK